MRSLLKTLVPASLRLNLWYLRHTGQTYHGSLPQAFRSYRQQPVALPTADEATQRVRTLLEARPDLVAIDRGMAAIILVTYHNLDVTRLTLKSVLEKTVYPNYQILVVDNGSGPEMTRFLLAASEEHPRIRLILNERNFGFAAANNLGIRAAHDARYVVLLNNDVIVTPGWLSTLIGHLRDPRVGMVGPVTSFAGNEARIRVPYKDLDAIDDFARRYTRRHADKTFEIPMLALFCAALRRDVVERAGPLDERFGIGLFEDDDYALRVRALGLRLLCAEDVFVHHIGRASFSRLEREQMRRQFEHNQALFETKWQRAWRPPRRRSHWGRPVTAAAMRAYIPPAVPVTTGAAHADADARGDPVAGAAISLRVSGSGRT